MDSSSRVGPAREDQLAGLERREERLVDLATETGGVRAVARRLEKLEEERREIMALAPEPAPCW